MYACVCDINNFYAYTASSCIPDLLNASYKLKKINHCVCACESVCGVSPGRVQLAFASCTGVCVFSMRGRERANGVKSSGWLSLILSSLTVNSHEVCKRCLDFSLYMRIHVILYTFTLPYTILG